MSEICVKICGLSEPQTMQAALDAGADMIGLVSFPKSPRHVDLATMGTLADQVRAHGRGHERGRAQIVILTVNASDDELATINAAVKPDWWQLHGSENAARISEVQSQFGRPVMKALGIGSEQDVHTANSLVGLADKVLLDAKPPKDATRPGGLGEVFDWTLLDGLDRSHGFMLSGGLNPTTVGPAIIATSAPGVDVSSGVESAPGRKDAALIAQFVANAKSAQTAAQA